MILLFHIFNITTTVLFPGKDVTYFQYLEIHYKLHIFYINDESVLLYGSIESHKPNMRKTSGLGKQVQMFWPNRITVADLLILTHQVAMGWAYPAKIRPLSTGNLSGTRKSHAIVVVQDQHGTDGVGGFGDNRNDVI